MAEVVRLLKAAERALVVACGEGLAGGLKQEPRRLVIVALLGNLGGFALLTLLTTFRFG